MAKFKLCSKFQLDLSLFQNGISQLEDINEKIELGVSETLSTAVKYKHTISELKELCDLVARLAHKDSGDINNMYWHVLDVDEIIANILYKK